jgi:glutamine---fructose-6-phosphate transaminase (isomerizing)
MSERGKHTISEILSQPDIWRDALTAFNTQSAPIIESWKEEGYEQVMLTGCGSTYYAAQIGAALFQEQTGVPARAYTATELMLFPKANFQPHTNTLFIAVSRSGKTRETIQAAKYFQQHCKGKIAVITATSDSELVKEADFVLSIDSAQEISMAQTRSFTSMIIQLQALAGAFSGQDTSVLDALPEIGSRLLADYADLARQLGEDTSFKQFVFLGSGVLYGLACEAMLKMLEISLVPSLAFHALEFLHGPRYIVREQMPTLLIGLVSDDIFNEEIAALKQAHERGAKILATVEDRMGSDIGEWSDLIHLQSGLPIWARTILYLPVLQLLVYHQGMTRGNNPDRGK